LAERIAFQFRVGQVLHFHHLFAEHLAQSIDRSRSLPLDQGQGDGVALLRFHIHPTGRIQAHAFQGL
jgi:hypothetical protein